jgi:hypothetical protein
MTILNAYKSIIESFITAAGVHVLVVNNMEAANLLSALINMEGGTGNITGPFKWEIGMDEEGANYIDVYHVDLSEIPNFLY